MDRDKIIDLLSVDGNYMIHSGNERRSVSVTQNERIYNSAGELDAIKYNDEFEDLKISIDLITHVERLD